MRIGIIGGAGRAWSAIYREAVKRGDQPTAIEADAAKAEGILGDYGSYLAKDPLKLSGSDLASFDVVVDAFLPESGPAAQLTQLAKHLVELARQHEGPRLVFVFGPASMLRNGRKVLDELYETDGTAATIGPFEQQDRALTYLRSVDDVDWVAISTQTELHSGPAVNPIIGGDELIIAADGSNRTSTGSVAVAVLDEIHDPQHRRTRISVADGS